MGRSHMSESVQPSRRAQPGQKSHTSDRAAEVAAAWKVFPPACPEILAYRLARAAAIRRRMAPGVTAFSSILSDPIAWLWGAVSGQGHDMERSFLVGCPQQIAASVVPRLRFADREERGAP